MDIKKKIALIGGSFDPPTIAHIQIGAEIYNTFDTIDEVWYVPCGDGRDDKALRTKGIDRVAMLKLILKDIIGESVPIIVNEIEVKNKKYYPTIDLLETLKAEYPDNNFIFCMGTDLIEKMPLWHRGTELFEKQEFIILTRPEYNPDKSLYPVNYTELKTVIDGSSTQVRNRIRDHIDHKNKVNLGINGLTTTSVIKYITQHKLYTENKTEDVLIKLTNKI